LSVAENIASPQVLASQAPLGRALRNILLSLALAVFSLALVGYFWREQGYEMLIVAMGGPHVFLGFSFFLGRVLRGVPGSRKTFVILGLATLVICAIHSSYSITGLIYLYFLFHLFRDEIFVYLQTRARHRPGSNVYAVAGVAPLILLILLIPKQEFFRHDLRRVEFDASQIANNKWMLIPFTTVPNSRGRDFYFYLQAPHTGGLRAFTTSASASDTRDDGEIIVGKQKWADANDLVFRPHYDSATNATPPPEGDVPVLLTGGHSVGQTFTAEANNLSGIWIPIERFEQSAESTRFVFHLASPPLLPYPTMIDRIRVFLMFVLAAVVIWRLIPRRRQGWQLWIYLAVLAGAFASTQTILKTSNNAGYAFPLIFQFAVVFHYWSWYVFSFDKLRSSSRRPATFAAKLPLYDQLLSYLGSTRHFTIAVISLNLIWSAAVIWYYRMAWQSPLRYFLDYNYFLYVLVFHVTFSFRPDTSKFRVPSFKFGKSLTRGA
jgi:hypothetical protein